MGLYSTLKDAILSKISQHKRKAQKPAPSPTSMETNQPPADKNANTAPATPPRLTAVELASQLDVLAAESSEKLQWRTSIVDLMKLVGMDSSYDERKEMARDLGYSQADIDSKGSAEMNIWLHKKVMEKLSKDTDGDLSVV